MDKIISTDFRSSSEVKLPLSGITIEIYNSLLVADLSGNNNLISPESTEDALKIIVKIIKKWNFFKTKEDNEPLPITSENLKLLPIPDFLFLNEKFVKINSLEKKT